MSGDSPSQLDLFDCIHNFLVDAECNEVTEDHWASFEQLLRESDDACRLYFEYVEDSGNLQTIIDKMSGEELPFSSTEVFFPEQQEPIGSILISVPSNTIHSPLSYLSSDCLVAYSIATVIMGIAALIAGFTYVSHPEQVDGQLLEVARESVATGPQRECVGRITGIVDCRWADSSIASVSEQVAVGRKIAIASGLMEITYDTGAKVILQGPVAYEVDSKDGGYLSRGKLSAKVETRAEDGSRRAEDRNLPSPSGRGAGGEGRWTRDGSAQTQIALSRKERGPNPNPSSTLRPSPSALFSVRTPTSIVTDLGTEFGVEVDKQGNTMSCVFSGSIRVQAAAVADQPADTGRVLHDNESLRMELRGGRILAVNCDAANASDFCRQLPRRAPIRLFNTGQEVEEGQEDPHWQVVAKSDSPNFQPQQAVVYSACANWLQNQPSRCQWISLVKSPLIVRNGVTYTFQTTFSLEGFRPETCVLHGLFIADNCVRSIRINGHEVPVPKQITNGPFAFLNRFSIDRGFVKGTNTLEFDVDNEVPLGQLPASAMAIRVELNASAVLDAGQDRP